MVGRRFVRLQLVLAFAALGMVNKAGYSSKSEHAVSRIASKPCKS